MTTKLTYINEQQFINDAAQMLLERHLHWGDSQRGMPSRDIEYVQGQVINAYREAIVFPEHWAGMSMDERSSIDSEAELLFVKAAQLADRKWQAAMILLGIEQQ